MSQTPGIDAIRRVGAATGGPARHGDWLITAVAETGSTNDDLLHLAAAGDLPDRAVLRADHQTAGRGRLDRRWDAPPGSNLLASIHFADPGAQPGTMLQRIGVAIVDAVDGLIVTSTPADTGRPEVGLKWPNDVLVDRRKLSGVLAQLVRSPTGPAVQPGTGAGLVVGFGVNVAWAPPEAASLADLNGNSGNEQGSSVAPADLLLRVLDAFDALPDDRDEFGERYRSRLLTIGERVRIHLPDADRFDGDATGVDSSGRIIVQPDSGAERTFDAGDVVHLRPGD